MNQPYCGPGAAPETFWTDWNFDPPLLLGLVALSLVLLASGLLLIWRRYRDLLEMV